MKNKKKTIPVFVSHMGCPNDCAFCNQRSITGSTKPITPKIAETIIETSLKTIPADSEVEIGFFGGSFTGIDETLQKELLEVANGYKKRGLVHKIRLSTRPDYINESIVSMLKDYGVTTIELGAQSMENRVLEKSRRGHTKEDTILASNIIKSSGIALGLQMMTGLPGDTQESALKTAEEIIALAPDCVRIYPTLVLSGTELAKLYQDGEFVPETLEDAVSLCAKLKVKFLKANIPVIRMGLMASDNINPEKDVLAGPFHPAFGELVQSEIYFNEIKDAIVEDAEIAVNPKDFSAFCGNKKSNIKRFKEQGISVTFVQDETVHVNTFEIIRKKGGRTCG